MEESRKEVEREMEKEIEKQVEKAVTSVITILVTVAVAFVVTVVLLKFVWAWVVPDLFPGAVDQGILLAELTWLETVKFVVLVGMLSGLYPTFTEAFKGRVG